MKKFLLFLILILSASTIFAQINSSGCSITGNFASAAGIQNSAIGNGSFVGGFLSEAHGNFSFCYGNLSKTKNSYTIAFGNSANALAEGCVALGTTTQAGQENNSGKFSVAIGNNSAALGESSIAIGTYINATSSGSIIIGKGYTGASFLTAPANSFAVGINSTVPTFFVGNSTGGVTGTGNVGIATTTPGSKLQVNGNAAIGYSSSTAAPANGLVIAGNVGLGTTSPNAKLHVKDGNIRFENSNLYFKSGRNGIIFTNDYPEQAYYFNMGISNDFIISNESDFNMTFKNSYLGIGTREPQSGLHYKNMEEGIFTMEGNGSSSIDIYPKGLKGMKGKFGFTNPNNDNLSIINEFENENIILIPSNTGKVCIGNSSPTGKLDVNSSGTTTLAIHQRSLTSSDTGLLCEMSSSDGLAIDVKNGTTKFVVYGSGKTQIGSKAIPGGYMLAVDGKIICDELKVKKGTWSDFVFEENYNLPTIYEVEQHIKQNKHLKDIPSAKEVINNGIDIGTMNQLLLQKIEELTLYIIQQQKEIDELKKNHK